jgi:hypothetical protein
MDQASEFVRQNSSVLGTVALIVVLLAILYVVYSYLYPGDDANYVVLLKGEADARHVVPTKSHAPTIYTGGDFTISFWFYVDDWNYRANSSKFVFALSPVQSTTNTTSPLVGMFTPLQPGLMVRAHTVGKTGNVPAPGTQPAATGDATPDITIESNLQALLKQQTSMQMFQTSLDAPCDVKEVPLQRWVCCTIVSSGRVLDIYIDGKLQRSCVLDNVIHVPRGPLRLRLGESGGFGGRYASVQMWNQQLTPDVIYGIYQMGPTQGQHNIIKDITKYLDLNVTFTGSAPGQPIPSAAAMPTGDPFNQLYTAGSADLASAEASVRGMMSRY